MRSLILLLVCASTISAAPPTLTSLYPSGGQRGKTVEVTASGTFPTWPMQAWASDKGIEIKPAKTKGRLSVAIAPDVQPGTYWMRLVSPDGASEQRPFLVGSLPEVLEVEPNNDPKKPQVLAKTCCVVNGRLNPNNDVDHYAVDLKRGQTLIASLQANSLLRSPMDGVLQILSADGFVLAENNDFNGLDPQVAYSIPKDGRYLVRVFAFPATPGSDISFFGSELCIYRLTLTTAAFADHPFPLAMSLKEPVPIELHGWNIPVSAKKIVVKPDGLSRQFPIRHPGVANPVAIRIEPHPCIVEIEPNDRARPQAVKSPVTISGHIDPPRDIDAFSLPLEKGDKRQLRVEARTLGSALDAVLTVFDPEGILLEEIDDVKGAADPELLFTAPASGTYRIEVRDRFQHGGDRYYYRLRIVAPEPDFSLTVAADQFTVTAGESLEIPVTVERLNGFAKPIEIRAVDLPEGIECSPVKIEGSAKSVKLKLTAKKDALPGAFRIEGSSGSVRVARSKLPAFGAETEAIWLSVRAGKK